MTVHEGHGVDDAAQEGAAFGTTGVHSYRVKLNQGGKEHGGDLCVACTSWAEARGNTQ